MATSKKIDRLKKKEARITARGQKITGRAEEKIERKTDAFGKGLKRSKARRKLDKATKKISKGFAAKSDAKMERKFDKATKKTVKARNVKKKIEDKTNKRLKRVQKKAAKVSSIRVPISRV